MDREELERTQPVLSAVLTNGLESGSLPQAILLYGSPRCCFREVSRFIARSLACSSGGLACGECPSCRRFLSGVHPDYIEIDGGDGTIKKETVGGLRDFFSMSAVENSSRRRSYAIIDCQRMTEEAANAILKFLEEPSPMITAILTSPTLEMVLPTIVSRCEPLKLNPRSREDIYASLYERYSPESAYFLSSYSGDEERLVEAAENDSFQLACTAASDFIQALGHGKREASYSLLTAAQTCQGKTECYNFFYGNVSRFLGDALAQDGLFGPFAAQIERFGREEPDLAARMELSLRESWSMSRANFSFTGVLAKLALMLVS